MSVAAIKQGEIDSAGVRITTVYAKRPPDYAVYGTDERVMVHYADDGAVEKTQRTSMAPLNPARGEINGLIDGWRTSWFKEMRANAKRYDRRVADALVMGLEEDPASASTLLDAIKKDIIDERTSWARFLYLITAWVAELLIVVACTFFGSRLNLEETTRNLVFAASMGAAGAFFSIAIAIRGRTVLTDLRFRDNTADAVLRVVIGSIAAVLLVAFLLSKAIDFHIGDAKLDPTDPTGSWLFLLVAAFLGGFSERLVPDLLGKFAASVANGTAPQGPASAPTTLAPKAAGAAAATGTAVPPPVDPMHREDHCLSDLAVQPHEATPDTELPPASGGVAARRG